MSWSAQADHLGQDDSQRGYQAPFSPKGINPYFIIRKSVD
jgi:hypothetical protein